MRGNSRSWIKNSRPNMFVIRLNDGGSSRPSRWRYNQRCDILRSPDLIGSLDPYMAHLSVDGVRDLTFSFRVRASDPGRTISLIHGLHVQAAGATPGYY